MYNIISFIKNILKFKRQQKLINNILNNQDDFVVSDSWTNNYIDWLFLNLLDSKTFDNMFWSYLKNIVYPNIQKDITYSKEIQKNILYEILDKTKHTFFWKKNNFREILKIDNFYKNFSQKIKVSSYDDFKEFIDLSKHKKDVLWPGKINKFSVSAGTTSRQKNIPITEECLDSMSKVWLDTLATYITKYPKSKIFSSYFWPLTWTVQEQKKDWTIFADISALLTIDRNRLLQRKYKFPIELLLQSERNKKRDNFVKNMDPDQKTIILWVTSWVNEMIMYIKQTDKKKFKKFIKNLELVIRWWVSAKPYIRNFKKLWFNHIWVYNASEWYFGYQDIVNYDNKNAEAPYQLAINHWIFYEFIVFDKNNFKNWIPKKNAKIITLQEINNLHINNKTKFALVITNNSWLFRYMIWDVIQFVDLWYRFKIVWRTKQCINIKWEELMEDHVNNVIQKVNKEFNISIENYTIWPDKENNPTSHFWLIQWFWLHKTEINILTAKIDKYLQQENKDYEAKRKNDILLKMPQIIILPDQTFQNWLKQKNKLGWQYKIPKLSNDRKNIDEILNMIS